MDAVNYVGSHPAGSLGGNNKIESHKSIFSSFANALKETRRREARRVIATYAHLLARDDSAEPQRGK